ncbi:hypothetical protein ES708_27080 [subsurface metagenome]
MSPGEVPLKGIKALPANRNPALFFRLLAVGKDEAPLPVYILTGQGQELRYPQPGIAQNGNQGSLHRGLAIIEELLYFIKLKVVRDALALGRWQQDNYIPLLQVVREVPAQGKAMGGHGCRLSSPIEELLYPFLGQLRGRLPPIQEALKLLKGATVNLLRVLAYRAQGAPAVKVFNEVIDSERHGCLLISPKKQKPRNLRPSAKPIIAQW